MSQPTFADLQLSAPILKALKDVGYEVPSPIQAQTIPLLLEHRDVLGQAQTGTGKTAAFALPILSRIDIKQHSPQALVLAPTRELAIQVAEAFQSYAAHIPKFHVLPIYGGQAYGTQLSALRRGVHVVVGTPGRVIDHIEKGSLDLSQIKYLVLDEADEMLRMGFIEDVETILQRTPESRQTALFSATMPAPIKRIAKTYLNEPAEITVAAKTGTAENIRQRFWMVSGMQKLDALTRILEAEPFDGMIIFARTKLGTEELATKLQARGFAAAAINGDLAQAQRERTIGQLKDGKIDILVATDVAARGLDVERISHVVNYDVPSDPESYTHRIGRTGRAGRSGEAILFITPREQGLLKAIERATRQPVSPMALPTVKAINEVRMAKFKDQISATLAEGGLDVFRGIIEDYEREQNVPAIEIAAALAKLSRGGEPLLIEKPDRSAKAPAAFEERPARPQREWEEPAAPRMRKERIEREPEPGMATWRIEVGHFHGVKPGNIVGAIANEAGVDAKKIGRIEIYDDFSTLDMPADLSRDVIEKLQGVRVAGQNLRIRRDGEQAPQQAAPAKSKAPSKPREGDSPMQLEKFTRPLPEDEAPRKKKGKEEFPMEPYRIEVGNAHGAKPANIVGAIANEAGLEAKFIGRIEINEDHSIIDLPAGMPKEVMEHLKTVWVAGQQLKISRSGESPKESSGSAKPMFGERKAGAARRVAGKDAGSAPPKKRKQ
ncbi:DEAD/DEAH box helicase [Pseudoduganella sp. GCM10020061]|uniref:DEAD/DEAH box helicase n=1 Tax=Pseudoduganella sp. GCM10020061 TaxID=3317345 RepID=UPI00363695F6